MAMTNYTDPSSIDLHTVMGTIRHEFLVRSHTWTDEPVWPNVTVAALAMEVDRLRGELQRIASAAQRGQHRRTESSSPWPPPAPPERGHSGSWERTS